MNKTVGMFPTISNDPWSYRYFENIPFQPLEACNNKFIFVTFPLNLLFSQNLMLLVQTCRVHSFKIMGNYPIMIIDILIIRSTMRGEGR